MLFCRSSHGSNLGKISRYKRQEENGGSCRHPARIFLSFLRFMSKWISSSGGKSFPGFANGFVAAAMAIISVSVQSSEIGVTLGAAQTALVIGDLRSSLGGALSEFIGMRGSFCLGSISMDRIAGRYILCPWTCFKGRGKYWQRENIDKRWHIICIEEWSFKGIACNFVPASGNNPDDTACHLFMGQKVNGDSGNVELVSGFIMSSGGLAGALTTALWGKFGQSRGYYAAMFITLSFAGVITIAQSIPSSIIGFGICQFLVGCFVIGINPSWTLHWWNIHLRHLEDAFLDYQIRRSSLGTW